MNHQFFSANSSADQITSNSTQHKQRTLKPLLSLAYLLLPLFAQTIAATDYYAEYKTRLALQKQYLPNEIVWLTSDSKTKTLALYKEASGAKKLGAAIILSDLGHHPDWPIIIKPLRQNLARHGWQTLSVHMPQAKPESSSAELESLYQTVKTRVKLALNHMTKNQQNLVVIAHGHTANIVIRHLAENLDDQQKVSAFVGISLFDSPWIQTSQHLEKIPIPILDVFAEYDTLSTLKSAPIRLAATRRLIAPYATTSSLNYSPKAQALAKKKTGRLNYRQTIIHGAYAGFSHRQAALVKTIRGWLQHYSAK